MPHQTVRHNTLYQSVLAICYRIVGHRIFFNKMPTKRSKYTMAKMSANKLEQ